MNIDVAMAARFLAALPGSGVHTFQTFGEGKAQARALNRILHGSFERQAFALKQLNQEGAGVFFMVNQGDQRGRRVQHVTGTRALFVDLDGAPLEPVIESRLPPPIVVESSPSRWHCYWPIGDLPLQRFKDAQRALAREFGGDTTVHDLPRVMRLPGFFHQKGEPFQTRLVQCESTVLTWREMAQAFRLPERFELPNEIREGARNPTLYQLALSAARKGVPKELQLLRASQVNRTRCNPPLDEAEVRQIVGSAYSRPRGGVQIPLEVIDSEAYKALGDGARTLLTLAYRRHDRFTEAFPLVWSELRHWIRREKTFQAYRRELVDSGFLQVAQAPQKSMPRLGRGPRPTFYRLPNRGE